MEWLNWVGTVVLTVLGLFGVNKLLEKGQERRYARKDKQQHLSEANEGKRIDADQEALKIILGRLEKVEEDLRQVHAAHNALMVKNAELQKDAEHNEKEIARQAEEIKLLRSTNHTLRNDLQQRDAKLQLMEARITQLEALLAQYQNGSK